MSEMIDHGDHQHTPEEMMRAYAMEAMQLADRVQSLSFSNAILRRALHTVLTRNGEDLVNVDLGELSSLMTDDEGDEIRIVSLYVNGDEIDIRKAD